MIRLPTELIEVLKQGGSVVVPSRQRAHAARLAYAAAELGQGRRVWATPDILSADAWLTREVERHAATAGIGVPRLLSPAEEWFLWRQCTSEATGELELVNRGALAEALRRASAIAADFEIDVRKLARSRRSDALSGVVDAHEASTEATLLSEVQRAVDERCRALGAATASSLVSLVRAASADGGVQIVASGFLVLPPRLRSLVVLVRDAASDTASDAKVNAASDAASDLGANSGAAAPTVVIASDELDELERIAQWCKTHVERDPNARLLVALPGAPGSRERLATLIRQAINPRGWLGVAHPDGPVVVAAEAPAGTAHCVAADDDAHSSSTSAIDSLVVIEGAAPLARVPAVAHALLTLAWLGGTPGDFEAVSNWLRAPYWKAPAAAARARLDLWLRERERMHFDLRDLVGALNAAPSALAPAAKEIAAQVNKATVALGQGAASPREWSERFRSALEVFDWPGERTRGSGEQQTVVRFHELLDEFGQLAAATRSISRDNAIQWFTELATRTAHRPADDDAVITITSAFAAPVVRYDAIWIAGLHAEAFPQPVQPDPFIPLVAQLAAGVPAASAPGRLHEAHVLLSSWRASTNALVLSAPARAEDLELLPSPLLAEWIGKPHAPASASEPRGESAPGARQAAGSEPAVPPPVSRSPPATAWLPTLIHRDNLLESVEDETGVAWTLDKPLPSGTRSLELQNNCPFRAYAEMRLGSTPLDAPEPGIAADMRGQLLHAALQKLWQRLRDSRGLASLQDVALDAAIHRSVDEAANELASGAGGHRAKPAASNDTQGDLFGGDPNRSPALTRECRRAERLIRALCAVERERAPFRVENTEFNKTLTLNGAQLNMRIDRVDALESGGRAILDYKSGRRAIADWYGERPSHPQLLTYLAALGDDVEAMATVNVTAREVRFDGIASSSELLPKVKGVEAPFGTDPDEAWPFRRQEWVARVEQLATAFVAGHAAVDPKPGACDYCHVASVCRIADRNAASEEVPAGEAPDA